MKSKNRNNSTRIETIKGHEIRLTPRNELFILTPDGEALFVNGHDARGAAIITNSETRIPAAVLREAGFLFLKLEAAEEASFADSLCDPPLDLIEDDDIVPTGAELQHGVEELVFA